MPCEAACAVGYARFKTHEHSSLCVQAARKRLGVRSSEDKEAGSVGHGCAELNVRSATSADGQLSLVETSASRCAWGT